MRKRKTILKLAGTFIIVFALLCACKMEDKAEEAVPRLNVEKVIVKLLKNGLQADGSTATIQIVANKGYDIKSNAEWLLVDKPTGSGLTVVEITAMDNDTDAERMGELLVSSGNLQETIKVYQSMEDPEATEPNRILYQENFDWAISFAKEDSDPVGSGQGNSNRTKITDTTVAEAWATCGLEDWNPGKDCISIYHDYLHFNSNGNFDSGVILPTLRVSESTDILLSFAACPDGKGPDQVPIVVEILSGSGTLSDDGTEVRISHTMTPEAAWTWTPFQIKLYGIDNSTQIAIRTTGNGANKYCRWFLDNINIQKEN